MLTELAAKTANEIRKYGSPLRRLRQCSIKATFDGDVSRPASTAGIVWMYIMAPPILFLGSNIQHPLQNAVKNAVLALVA